MSGLSDYDREHIDEILAGEGDWFTAQLLRLIVKADNENRRKLAIVFPQEVELVRQWKQRGVLDELTHLGEEYEGGYR